MYCVTIGTKINHRIDGHGLYPYMNSLSLSFCTFFFLYSICYENEHQIKPLQKKNFQKSITILNVLDSRTSTSWHPPTS